MTLTLTAGTDSVVVDPQAGGRIASLVAGGAERLVTRDRSDGGPTMWGCFLMVPFAGRLARGEVPWDGKVERVPTNLGPHAIHGCGFDEAWEVVRAGDDRCTLTLALPTERWPFAGRASHHVHLSPGRLGLTAEVQATSASMPLSVGWHPWFRRPDRGDLRVRVQAPATLVTDRDLIPTGDTRPVEGDTDLRSGPVLGQRRLDHVYVEAASPAVVAWPDLELHVGFALPVTTVVVYTPPGAACVEPQSAWPNAVQLEARGVTGTGLIALAPGASVKISTWFAWRSR